MQEGGGFGEAVAFDVVQAEAPLQHFGHGLGHGGAAAVEHGQAGQVALQASGWAKKSISMAGGAAQTLTR